MGEGGSMAARVSIPILVLVLGLTGLFFLLRPDPSASGAPSAGRQEETLEIEIREGAMVPDEITVGEDDRVELRVTSDSPAELHLHGYDLEEEVEPGEPAKLSFDASISGSFEIEDHATGAVLGRLLVQPR